MFGFNDLTRWLKTHQPDTIYTWSVTNTLFILSAGIRPADGKFHTMSQIKNAITKSVGYEPFIECNVDSSGYHQLYQVYQCVDASASNFIKCPIYPHGRPCGDKVEFPSFASASSRDEL